MPDDPGDPDPRAVLAAFGLRGEVLRYEPVEGGWSNRVLRLTTTEHDLAVKEIRNPWGVAAWRQWLDEGWRLERAALAAGVRAPEPLTTSDGGCLVEVPRADGSGTAGVRAHRWVAARPVPREPLHPGLALRVGELLGRVHALALRPLDPALYADRAGLTTVEVWPDLVARSAAAGAPWTEALRASEPVAARASALLHPWSDDDAVLVHADLDQKNLLRDADGLVLLDWDVVVPALPSHDVAHAALTMACWSEPAAARAVIAGYCGAVDGRWRISSSDLGPALASRLGWIRFTVDRALDAGPDGFVAAGHEIDGLLKNLVHRVEVSEDVGEWLSGRWPAA